MLPEWFYINGRILLRHFFPTLFWWRFSPTGHITQKRLRFWIYKSDGLHQSHGFQQCIVNLTEVGIEIQHDDQQQWFIPWEAMPEIYDGSTSRYLLPDSHPHVKHLCARFSFGFSSCTGCQFHLASSSLDQLDAISRIVQLRSSQSVAMEGLPGSEAAFEEISPQSMGTTSPIVGNPTPRAPPRLDTTNQAEVPVEPEPVPVEPHTMQMPKELLKALLDEATTPQPLTLQHCWLHLPPMCPQYQRCVVCVDKLGLSLRPLGRSKYPADELHRISGLKILHTESLNFPLSSILNVEEVAGHITEQVMEKPAETQTWRTHFGRKHFLPLARLVFSRSFQAGSVGQKQKPCPEAADQLPAAAAYFVNVKIRAGITGKIPGQDSRRNSRKSPIFCVGVGGGKFLVSLCLS